MDTNTSHLAVADWDLWVAGTPSEGMCAHLDACVECRSIADRLSLDASPRKVFQAYKSSRGLSFGWTLVAAVVFGVVAATAAVWYGAAFLRAQEHEVALNSRVLQLEAQLASVKTELPPAVRNPAPTDAVSSAELNALKDTLARLQREAITLAAHRTEDQSLRAQLRMLEQQNAGNKAALEAVRSEYEAKLKKNEELLSSVRAQLSATQAELSVDLQGTTTNPAGAAADVGQHLTDYAQASGLGRVVLTSKEHQGASQFGFIALTADSSRLEEVQKLFAEDPSGAGKVYFLGPKASLSKCKGPSKGCVTVDFTKQSSE